MASHCAHFPLNWAALFAALGFAVVEWMNNADEKWMGYGGIKVVGETMACVVIEQITESQTINLLVPL
jgi:hypothetical protein